MCVFFEWLWVRLEDFRVGVLFARVVLDAFYLFSR